MSAHQGGSRRPRKSSAFRSFKPAFDSLENRTLPSGVTSAAGLPPVVGGPGQVINQDPIAILPGDPQGSGVVTVSTQHLKVTAGGDAATFTVVLNSAPTAEVDVTLAQFNLSLLADGLPGLNGDNGGPTLPGVGGDTQLTINPPHLAFTTTNWNQPQTVSVSAPAGNSSSWGEVVWVFGTTSSADPNFDAQAVPPVTVAVVNDTTVNPAGVTVSKDHLEVQRGGTGDSYTIALTSAPTADVTINIAQFDPRALATLLPGSDPSTPSSPVAGTQLTITPSSLTFTPDDWSTAQTVSVSAPAGQATLPDEGVLLFQTVTSDDPNYNNLLVPPVLVKVENNPAIGVVLSTDHLEVTRGGGSDSYTLALTSQPAGDVTVTVAQGDPTLLGWPSPQNNVADIAPLPGGHDPLGISPTTLTFTADDWSTAQTVTVSPPTTGSGDQFDWLVETAASTADPNYNLPLPGVGVTVIDPSAEQAGLVLSTQELKVVAGGDAASYTVALASQPTANVTIAISQVSPVLDPPGLVGPGGSATGTPPTGDSGPLDVTPALLTFTPGDWNTAQTVKVSAPASQGSPLPGVVFLEETVTSDDPNYNGLIAPSVFVHVESSTTNPAGVVLSKDHLEVTRGGTGDSAGTGDSYTIALASQPAGDVTVTVTQVDENAAPPGALPTTNPSSGPNDPLVITPTTLTFTAADWSTPQTVNVSPPTTGSGDQKDWLVETAASTADPNYNLRLPTIGVSVIDPSAAQAGLVLSKQKLDVTFVGPGDSFTITLASQPTAEVDVTVSQANDLLTPVSGGALLERPIPIGGGTPLVITPTTLTFLPGDWNTPQTVQVSAPATATSGTVFGLEVLNEQATSTDNNYNGLSGPPVYVTVEGSDTTTLGSVVLSKDHLEVTRGGAGDSYTVALASQPAGDVTITVTQVDENVPPPVPLSLATTNDSTPPSTGPNDPLVITPTTLTFTAADWNTPQTVTVSPPTTGSGDQSDWLVETAASTADPSYNLRLPTIGVSVIDPSAEQAGLVLSKDSLDVTAGGTGDSYTVALASKPTGTVTVTISQVEVPPPLANPSGNVEWPADGSTPTTLTITPTTLTFTADDWSTPQTVQVSAPAPATGSAPGSGFEFDLLQQQVASSDPNYDGLHSAPVFVRVRDSSTTANPAGLVLSKEELTVTPGGTGDSYTVALASQPTGDVTITIDQVNAVPPPPGPAATGAVVGVPIPIGGDTQLTVTPSTLTFTADNWSKPQTVQVSAPAPTDPTAPGVSQVEWLIQTVASSDANYNNLFVPPLGVAVVSPGQPVPTVPPVIPPPTGGAPVNVPGIAPPPVIVLPFIPAQPPHALQSSVTIHGTGNTGSHGGSKPTGTPHAPGTGAPASHPKATTHRGKHGKKPHRGKH